MKFLKITQPCILCGDKSTNSTCLCCACKDELPYMPSACVTCGLPIDASSSSTVCGACISSPPPVEHCISVLYYESPVDFLIKQMKYHNQLSIAELMGQLMATKITQHYLDCANNASLPTQLIPIPLHVSRLKKRGYNQASEIAKTVSHALNIPLNHTACKRVKSTTPQFDLPATERSDNIKNAFKISEQINAKHIALIDDVMTTGSTVWELANTLRQSGVTQIDVWVCARATTH